MKNFAPLVPDSFDQMVEQTRPRWVWGAAGIARTIGVSEDTIRRWALDPDIPIYCPKPRTYCAERGELMRWLRQKPAQQITE